MNFFIVNDTDRPQPSLVAYERPDGKLNYLDVTKKSYNGMTKDSATRLEDFGVVWAWTNKESEMEFKKTLPSIATYKDGSPRQWQGETYFTHKVPEDAA